MYEDLVIEGMVDEEALAAFLGQAGQHSGEALAAVAKKLEILVARGERAKLQGRSVSLTTMSEAALRLRMIVREEKQHECNL